MTTKRWFQKAVYAKKPNTLGGWSKSYPAWKRRELALKSRPSNWKLSTKYLSCGRALQALANVTKDNATRKYAIADAKWFFRMNKKSKK